MFAVLLSVCLVPAVLSIIVTDPPPTTSTEYNYSYNVVDPHTGDTKSLHEVRRGDVVTGSYTVLDPDGTRRIVEYTADSTTGFKAIVHSEPLPVPFHHAVNDRFFAPKGNTRYFKQYFASHTQYGGHPQQNRLKSKNSANTKSPRYFTPANEIKNTPILFKQGEYFAPNK